LGYDPKIQLSTYAAKPYLLLANLTSRNASEEEIERQSTRLSKLADEWGGEYDGWDRPM